MTLLEAIRLGDEASVPSSAHLLSSFCFSVSSTAKWSNESLRSLSALTFDNSASLKIITGMWMTAVI